MRERRRKREKEKERERARARKTGDCKCELDHGDQKDQATAMLPLMVTTTIRWGGRGVSEFRPIRGGWGIPGFVQVIRGEKVEMMVGVDDGSHG